MAEGATDVVLGCEEEECVGVSRADAQTCAFFPSKKRQIRWRKCLDFVLFSGFVAAVSVRYFFRYDDQNSVVK